MIVITASCLGLIQQNFRIKTGFHAIMVFAFSVATIHLFEIMALHFLSIAFSAFNDAITFKSSYGLLDLFLTFLKFIAGLPLHLLVKREMPSLS